MDAANYINIILIGFANNGDYLIEYFTRQANEAKEKKINYNEFFSLINKAFNLLDVEAKKQLYEDLLLADKYKIQEQNLKKWTKKKDTEHKDFIVEIKARDYCINLFTFTNNTMMGQLALSNIEYLKKQFLIAQKIICYDKIKAVIEVEAKTKFVQLKEDFVFRNSINAATLQKELMKIKSDLVAIEPLENALQKLKDKGEFGKNKISDNQVYELFTEYPEPLEYIKWSNNYYKDMYLEDAEKLTKAVAKIRYYQQWLLNELEAFVEVPKKINKKNVKSESSYRTYLLAFYYENNRRMVNDSDAINIARDKKIDLKEVNKIKNKLRDEFYKPLSHHHSINAYKSSFNFLLKEFEEKNIDAYNAVNEDFTKLN